MWIGVTWMLGRVDGFRLYLGDFPRV
jgi:hypothetical protein